MVAIASIGEKNDSVMNVIHVREYGLHMKRQVVPTYFGLDDYQGRRVTF